MLLRAALAETIRTTGALFSAIVILSAALTMPVAYHRRTGRADHRQRRGAARVANRPGSRAAPTPPRPPLRASPSRRMANTTIIPVRPNRRPSIARLTA